MKKSSDRLAAVLGDIDAANADDPRKLTVDGAESPYEIEYSRRMGERLQAMYPQASDLLQIAAHGQHIRRFDIPRDRHERGRKGYNQWRRAAREHHASLLADIMTRHGYSDEEIAQVADWVKKEKLKKDHDAQALENIVGVVFIEHYLGEFVAKNSAYGDEKLIDIIGKTLRKMSPPGHEAALALDLPEAHRRLILAAAEREAEALAKLAKVTAG